MAAGDLAAPHVRSPADQQVTGAKRIRGFDGVLAFFVLSGYLIIGILHRSRGAVEAERVPLKTAFQDFWHRRIARICPAYYAALFLVIAVEIIVLQRTELASAVLWYVAYLQNFYISFVQPGSGIFTQTWTLAVEQQFYLLFSPALLLIPAKYHLRAVAIALAVSFASLAVLSRVGLSQVGLAILPMYGMVFLAAGGLLFLGGKHIPAVFSRLGAFAIAAVFILWRIG